MAGELFKMMAGVDMVHVPYRGAAPALTDLLGGQVQVMFAACRRRSTTSEPASCARLAVTTATRSEALPDVPTVGDFVPGFEASAWYGIGAPKNTPAEIIDRLNKEINAGLADPKIKARLADLAARCFRARPPTSASSSPTKPRSGPRWSEHEHQGAIAALPDRRPPFPLLRNHLKHWHVRPMTFAVDTSSRRGRWWYRGDRCSTRAVAARHRC